MNRTIRRVYLMVLASVLMGCSRPVAEPVSQPNTSGNEQAAQHMIRASRGALAPVYGPLAEQIVEDFDLGQETGIGIDVGSGPGTLIIELCKRTKLHWINADINPHFFPHFFEQAEKHGFGHRVSAVFADAKELPFRSEFADVIVSRGSFHLWGDKTKAFGEIYRVLKPGAAAYIGRGLSRNLPLKTAKKVRAGQGGGPRYDVDETQEELLRIMRELGIKDYRVHRPRPDAPVNYGVWVEFHKPVDAKPNK